MNTELKTFYHSRQWLSLIIQLKLERAGEDGVLLCEYCGKPIVKAYDCIGHHKTELTAANVHDYSVSLNPDNIMLVHHRCHNHIHERFGFERPKHVYLVYGPPCGGKSTWVQANAGPEDLVLDIDNIWQMISINDRYIKPNRLKQNVFGVRDCILDQIRMRLGNWRNAYVVGGYPLRTDRERLEQLLSCECIFINESKETCLERAKNDDWAKYIDDWFDQYIP